MSTECLGLKGAAEHLDVSRYLEVSVLLKQTS